MSHPPRFPRGLRLSLAAVAGAGIAVFVYALGPWSGWWSSAADSRPHEPSVATAQPPSASVPSAGAPSVTALDSPAGANASGGAAHAPLSAVSPTPVPSATSETDVEPEPTTLTEESPPPVSITFRTVPAAQATVTWGAKDLGTIRPGAPLVVERPRDSGPLDVVIRARGYLPVNARAYTFADSIVDVRITPRSKKSELYGYRTPLPPLPDAGSADTAEL